MTTPRVALTLLCVAISSYFLTSFAFAAETPVIPLVLNSSPILDGIVHAEEWKGSLQLSAVGEAGGPATTFYVRHDGKAVWVAVHCDEISARPVMAQSRGAEGTLALDDAVTVALGLDGDVDRAISMGGYEGAMTGKLGSMAHLYEFTVNAAGSVARRYNETALPTPRFSAKVSRGAQGWEAEMQIPFESLGLSNANGREIYANFLRYRPPGIQAWRGMNHWGNYSPFPANRIRLAASSDEIVTQSELLKAVSSHIVKSGAQAAGSTSLELDYYPLANSVMGQAILPNGGSAVLTADDKTLKMEVEKFAPLARLAIDLPRRPAAGESIQARLRTRTFDGNAGPDKQETFKGVAVPRWAGTEAGLKFVNSAVPLPWKMPEVENNIIRLAHVSIAFGGNGLPKTIRGPEGELLARPINILVSFQRKVVAIQWQAKPTLRAFGNRVLVRGRGLLNGAAVELRTEVDFDGFMTVQLHFTKPPSGVDRIQLSCPLPKSLARYIARGNVQTVLPLDDSGYKATGGRFWIGAENAGLAFSTDLPFFHATEHRDEISVKNEAAVRELVITPFDRAEQIGRNPVLQFYLQPTPVRPRSTVTSDDYGLWFENWSDYQGYPDLAKMDKVKDFSKQMRDEGKVPLLYFNQMLAENAPEFAAYRDELINLPEKMWYKRAYDPGKDVPCYVCCVRGPYGDLLLDGIRQLAEQGDLGGIYMDGTSVAWDCDNAAHRACDERRAPVWNAPGQTRITGTRDFLKRLRGIFTERGKKFILIGHTGGDLDINTLGFVDYFWEGEQLVRYLPGYRIPQAQYAVGYSGGPWGYRAQFYDEGWLGTRGENWSLVYALLFNTDNQRGGARALLKPFETSGAAFHPYWKDGQRLLKKSKTARTSVSYYTAPKAVMLVASNLEYTADEIEIDTANLAAKDAIWVDLLTRTRYSAKVGKVRLTLPGYEGVVLRPLGQLTEAEQAPTSLQNSHVSPAIQLAAVPVSQWEPSGSTAVNTAPEGQLLLQSQPFAQAATATLKGFVPGSDLELTLKVKARNRLNIDLGRVSIVHDSGWKLDTKPDGWNEGRIRPVGLPADREVTLKVFLHGNHLSVTMDGQSIIDDMKVELRPQQSAHLNVSTWAGDYLEFNLVELNTRPVAKIVVAPFHPASP